MTQSIPAAARAYYMELGRQFGCGDVLAQAGQTLHALEVAAEPIAGHGFIAADGERLRAACEQLRQLMAQQASPACLKPTSLEYLEAVRAGKTARQRARAILYIVVQRLAFSDDELEAEAARAALQALQQTESSRGDCRRLAWQLEQLRAALSMPRIEAATRERGGPQTMFELARAADRLRALAQQTTDRASPHDEHVDLVIGTIVELVRDARRAARSASRTLELPDLASPFELTALYGSLARSSDDSEVPPRL